MEALKKLSNNMHTFKYENRKIELAVVDIDSLIPHEEVESRKIEKISRRMKESKCIKHVISCISYQNKLIILDGHHRLMSLKQLGYTKAPVQIVDKESVILDYWYHVIDDSKWNPAFVQNELNLSEVVAECRLKDSNHFIKVSSSEAKDVFAIVREIYQSYQSMDFSRQVEKPESKSWIKYSGLTIDTIIESALNSDLMPPGLSRFRIPYKVLNLEVPLHLLEGSRDIEWKEFYKTKCEFQVFDLPVINID